MTRCPSCGAAGSDRPFCPQCGAPLAATSLPTADSPPGGAPPAQPDDDRSSQRFLPGQMLGGRYRIVAPLGRGGMGEVYRADDLKLGQPVAIKLLPRGLEGDVELLQRMRNEVRLALRVTHPNVCRVFDLGEIDGRQFLSMEYVDGENLASLLRRIGRLPRDKALDVARQLCAGLAAAHEEGVLHRDLKPANVMIDGRGRAKITDFGLAGATRGIRGAEAMAGTPGYQAPEQIAGGELSEATDLYALGALLHELFTGERAFPGDSAAEVLVRQRSPDSAAAASSRVESVDPAAGSVVGRCLDPDPARRPASALAVAAALPGGDPLAAALAAGETPSPEMVAEAGGEGSLRPAVAVPVLVALLAGLALMPILPGRTLVEKIPLERPPTEMAGIARRMAEEIGYPERPRDRAWGYQLDDAYFERVAETDQSVDRWEGLSEVRPAPLRFWYRESPAHLEPVDPPAPIRPTDPLLTSGSLQIVLDPEGRLVRFEAVPPQLSEESDPWQEPEWGAFFARAGLGPEAFEDAPPVWAPLLATTDRRAWLGPLPHDPGGRLRVEAASFEGRPVFFALIPPWERPERMAEEAAVAPTFDLVMMGLAVLVLIGAALLAHRNRRLGRSDGRGARRLAAALLALALLRELTGVHLGLTSKTLGAFYLAFAWSLFTAGVAWVFYLALEPYARRLWPRTLIGWNRLLDGRLRDPLVGRHILLGGLCGLLFQFWIVLRPTINELLAIPADAPAFFGTLTAAATWSQALRIVVSQSIPTVFFPTWTLLLLVLLRLLLRSTRLASLGFVLLLSGLGLLALDTEALSTAALVVRFVHNVAFWTFVQAIVTRLGFLAMGTTILFGTWMDLVMRGNLGDWTAPLLFFLLAALAALAVHGFVAALGGRKVFRDMLEESG